MLWLVLRVVFLVAKWRIRPLAKVTVGMVVDKKDGEGFFVHPKIRVAATRNLAAFSQA